MRHSSSHFSLLMPNFFFRPFALFVSDTNAGGLKKSLYTIYLYPYTETVVCSIAQTGSSFLDMLVLYICCYRTTHNIAHFFTQNFDNFSWKNSAFSKKSLMIDLEFFSKNRCHILATKNYYHQVYKITRFLSQETQSPHSNLTSMK